MRLTHHRSLTGEKRKKDKRCDWCASPISCDHALIYKSGRSQLTACQPSCQTKTLSFLRRNNQTSGASG